MSPHCSGGVAVLRRGSGVLCPGVLRHSTQAPLLRLLLCLALLCVAPCVRAQGLQIAAPALVTTEAGGVVSASVSLLTTPTADVTVSVTSSNTLEGTVSPSQFVISKNFPAVVQVVQVTGVDDSVDDGDVSYTVSFFAQSTDAQYNTKSGTLTLTNTDNDARGVTASTSGTATTEAGGAVRYTVKLNSKPQASNAGIVTLRFTSSNAAEGVVSPSSIVFSTGNWDAQQTVTITGVDDKVQDGDVAYTVAIAVETSTDYSAVTVTALSLTNTDDDVAGIQFTPPSGVTTEAGAARDFAVTLKTQPAGTNTVTLTVASTSTAEGVVNATSLSFSATTWDVPQTIRVTGQDEKVDDGDVTYGVSLTVAVGSDAKYIGKVETIPLTNTDDDTAGTSAVPLAGLVTGETQSTATFTFVLASKPTANVVATAVSSDTTEGVLVSATITFTPADWDTPQTFTVRGVDDAFADGDKPFTVTVTTASTDTKYAGLAAVVVQASNTDDDTADVTVSQTSGLSTTEAGGTAEIFVVLTSEPTAPVTIPVVCSNANEGVVDKASLLFTSGDWSTKQTITARGVDDLVADGDVAYTVELQPAVSADAVYTARDAPDVTVINKDDDSAKIVVTPASTTPTTTEAGGTTSLSIVLNSKPTQTVQVAIQSSDTSEGQVQGAGSVSFTSATWDVPQSVTVVGINDDVDDGDQIYSVQFFVTSTDPGYNGQNPQALAVTNTDDDAVEVRIVPTSGLATSEGGAAASFTAVLLSKPSGTGASSVTIPLSVDTTEGVLSASSIVFTSGNWNVSQTITVTGVDDSVQDGDVQYAVVTGPAVSSDPNYNGLNPLDVSLTNSDNDTDSIRVSPTSGTTAESGATQVVSVVLNTQPSADVSITVATSDATEGTVNTTSLVFTPATWGVAQGVLVAGQPDAIADGDVQYTVSFAVSAGSAASYIGLTQQVALKNTDDDTAVISVSPAALATTEGGGSASVVFTLGSEPTENVALFLEVPVAPGAAAAEAKATPTSLVFTATNWQTAQTITVTGLDDSVVDGDVAYTVTYRASTADASYKLLSGSLPGVNADNDKASISATPASLSVAEAGGTAVIAVSITSKPTGAVVLSVAPTDATEVAIQPNTLVFKDTNWNAQQTVTVKGVDDSLDDGDVTSAVRISVSSSSDPNFASIPAAEVSVVTVDDDTYGFYILPASGLRTTEAGGAASFVVVLTSQPTSDVAVAIPEPGSEISITPLSVVFLTNTWDVPQTITVTGLDDSIDDGDQTRRITSAIATSADLLYGGAVLPTITVTNADDDVAGVLVQEVSSQPLATSEDGTQKTLFTVRLGSQPSYDVSIPLSLSDATEGVLSAEQIIFTPALWAVPQTVTVSGVDDSVADGDVAFTVTIGKPFALDTLYKNLASQTLSITNRDDDVVGFAVSAPGVAGRAVAESPTSSFSISVVLTSQPTHPVTIPVSVNDTSEAALSAATLSFEPAAYSTPQTVTVTGLPDGTQDGDQMFAVTFGVPASLDPAYAASAAKTVVGRCVDGDRAALVVSPTAGLTTSAAAQPAEITVMLASIPSNDVTVGVSVSDATEGSVSPAELVFTAASWNVSQTIQVSGVDDSIDDGNTRYTVGIAVTQSTADPSYRGLAAVSVSVTNVDDDTAGFNLSNAQGLSTTEAGGTASFSVVLTSQPSANVILPVSVSDAAEGVLDKDTLIFTPSNWAIAQPVKATGVDDFLDDGDKVFSVLFGSAVSSDAKYRGASPPPVSITNTDDDSVGIDTAFSGSLVTTEEQGKPGSSLSFTVKLRSQPASDVTVILDGIDATEGDFSLTRVVFVPSSWALPKTITVGGVDDSIDDGDVPYTVTFTTSTEDSAYKPVTASLDFRNIDDDTIGFVLSSTPCATTEAGGTHQAEVRLATEPEGGNVVLTMVSSDAKEGVVLPASVTFTKATWNTPQTVTVSGVDDSVADGDKPYTISLSAGQSSDVQYSALPAPSISCVNADNDAKGVSIQTSGGGARLDTSEGNMTQSFTVSLRSQPLQVVTIPVTSSDATEGIPAVSSLQFTTTNWNLPQTVAVHGVDDDVDDGDIDYRILLGAATGYYGIDPPDVNLTNRDDDTAGVSVTPSVTTVSEAGGTAQFTVALTSQPSSPVTVSVSSSDTAEGVVSKSSLAFSITTWHTPQTVTVSGVDDLVADGDKAFQIGFSVSSSDALYGASVGPPAIDFVNVDNDTSGVVVGLATAQAAAETTEAGGGLTLRALLASQPSGDVTVQVASSDTAEVKGTGAGVFIFTPRSWDAPQFLDVVGVDDLIDDGDKTVSITFGPAVSSDAAYQGASAQPITIINRDDDTAGVTAFPKTGLETDEAGRSATFTVVLNSQPLASVVVSLTSSDTTEGVVSPVTLEFTSANWFTPKTVSVAGQPDSEDDGFVEYSINFAPLASKDGKYHGMVVPAVQAVNAPLNCSQFACPVGTTGRASHHCPGGACTEAVCCLQRCASHTCTAPAILRPDADTTLCEAGPCSDTACCTESCSTYACPAATVRQASPCPAAGACTEALCCIPSCDGFVCSGGYLQKATPSGCLRTGCTSEVCCDRSCSTYTCPQGYAEPQPGGTPQRCPGQCTPELCCDPLCGAFACAPPLSAVAGAAGVRCTGAVCTAAQCCEDKCLGVACTATQPCRVDPVCDPASGQCGRGVPASDMSPCSLAGAASAVCVQGECVESIPCGQAVCLPSDAQCKAATCEGGVCSSRNKPDGTPCDDGSAATAGDACVAGACTGARLRCSGFAPGNACALRADAGDVVCPDSGCDAGTCCATCVGFDSAACPSGQASRDVCPPGGCTAAACCIDLCLGVTCPAPDQCHVPGACAAATGLCSDVPAADGTPCDDGLPSTLNDACQSGACAGVCASGCAAVDPRCTAPDCSASPCASAPLPDGTPCNDEDPSTLSDKCVGGSCSGTRQTCGTSRLATGCHVPAGTAGMVCPSTGCTEAQCCQMCSTVQQCPSGRVLDGAVPCPVGGCTEQACCAPDRCASVQCSPEEACRQAGSCDPLSGVCTSQDKPDGVGCSDGDATTANDRCQGGVCRGAPTTSQLGGQIVIDKSFFKVASSTASAESLLQALAQTLQAAGLQASNVRAVSMCAADVQGRRDATSCIPGSALAHLTDTSGSPSSGHTFLHFAVDVPSSAAQAEDTAARALQPGVVLQPGAYRVVAPRPTVSSGVCALVFCEPPGGCVTASCNPGTGVCTESPLPVGTSCDDGDPRTTGDVCANSACIGASAAACGGQECRSSDPQCYVSSCVSGACVEEAKVDGTPCSDGNPGTTNDRCRAGVCRGADLCEGVVCPQQVGCMQALPCDPATGQCVALALADGTACDDGDALTNGDQCASGVCVGSVSCAGLSCFAAEPMCHTPACVNGLCTQQPKQDWTPCDDGLPSTSNDRCVAGACVGEDRCAGVVCAAAGQCGEAGHCVPQSGVCTAPSKSDGHPCNDGDSATSGDKCMQGVCVGTVSCSGRTCPVNDTQCHTAACGSEGECLVVPKPDGTSCTDFNSATVEDRCIRGMCVGTDVCANIACSASDSCHDVGVCDPRLGVCTDPPKPFGAQCDDGNPNTMSDRCIDGVCRGSISCAGAVCTPSDPKCNTAACQNGQCIQVASGATTCNDNNPLTTGDTCRSGRCVGVDPCASVVCTASDACHLAGKCDPSTGVCSDPVGPDGTLCDDNNANSMGDTCVAGVCVGTVMCSSKPCVPKLTKCMAALCQTDLCRAVPKPDGVACNDGDTSTTGDQCRSGICVGVLRCGGVDCTVNEPQCHTVLCRQGRCEQVLKPEGAQCNDGDSTTTDDRCAKGTCTGTNKCTGVVCSASGPCHETGTCNEATGLCSDAPKADYSSCDDGKNDTYDDRCVSGVCVGTIKCNGQACVPLQPLCHTARCINNQCTQVADPPGTPCSDGNSSTANDFCSSGTCRGVDLCRGVVCPASDYCHEAGTCNPATGHCDDPMKPDGTICDDGVSATLNDQCIGGTCTGNLACSAAQCSAGSLPCVVPRCEQGACSTVNKPDGTACNDDNPGTEGDVCTAGVCAGRDRCAGVACAALTPCHEVGSCDRASGVCSQPRKRDGTPCDIGSQRNAGLCSRGSCVASVACRGDTCQVNDPQCHLPSCGPTGCTSVKKAVGTACDDGDPLTAGDRCSPDGGCSGSVLCGGAVCIAEQGQCYIPRCSNGVCAEVPKADGTACNDGNANTTDDVCESGKCTGNDRCAGVVCPADEMCSTYYCDIRTGTCLKAPRPDGTSCDDQNSGTQQDACKAGVCAGVLSCSGVPCPAPQQQCLEPMCTAGACDVKWLLDGTSCDDGDPATLFDACRGGSCVGRVTCGGQACATEKPMCHVIRCEADQCAEHPKPDGTPCNDGDRNTANDICSAGVCRGVDLCAAVECTATDECHAPGGCIAHLGICTEPLLEDGTSCDDGLAATVSDKCTKGACAGTQSCSGQACKPEDPKCHTAECKEGRCSEAAKPDSTPCNDDDITTLNDRCQGGKCVGDSKCGGVLCKAKGPCHSDGECVAHTGLCTEPLKADGTSCDDGDSSTTNDRCVSGTCSGSVTCGSQACTATSPQCSSAACSSAGQCVDVIKPEGIFCSDGNVSTEGDRCIQGKCVGQPSLCVPNPCGSSQACVANSDNTAFQCSCRAPLAGLGTNAPAVCRSKNSGCAARPSFCEQVGQRCASRASGEWVCFCLPPMVGALAGGTAECARQSAPTPPVAPVPAPEGVEPQQWGLTLADTMGIDPARVMVARDAAQGIFNVSFHGEAVLSGGQERDHLTAPQLHTAFLQRAGTCPSATSSFCTDLNSTGIRYAAAACPALTLKDACLAKPGCEWSATASTCSEVGDDDDGLSLLHLLWIVPVALLLLCAMVLCLWYCFRKPAPPPVVSAVDLPYEDMERLGEGESLTHRSRSSQGERTAPDPPLAPPRTPPMEGLSGEKHVSMSPGHVQFYDYDAPHTGIVAGPYPVGMLSKTGDGIPYNPDAMAAHTTYDPPYTSWQRPVRPSDGRHPSRPSSARYSYGSYGSPQTEYPEYGAGRAAPVPPPSYSPPSQARGPGLYPVKC